MAIRQLRRPASPLRFRLGSYFKPSSFLALFLALILFQGFFEFFFRFTIGISFLGIHARSLKLGMYTFAGLTAIYFLLREKPGRKPVRPGALLLGLILVEIVLGMGIAVYLGQYQNNLKYSLYVDALISILIIIPFAYAAVETVEDLYKVMRWFAIGLVVLAALETVARVGGAFVIPFRSLALTNYRLALPFAAFFFLVAGVTGPRLRLWDLACFAIAVMGVSVAFNKPIVVPFAGALAFVVMLLLLLPKRRVAYTRSRIIGAIFVISGLLVLFVVIIEIATPFEFVRTYWTIVSRDVLKLDVTSGASIGRVDGGRFYLYRQAWESFLQKPLFGDGLGVVILSDAGTVIPPHSIFFDLLVGTGLAGTIPVVTGGVIFFLYVLRNTDFTRMVELSVAMMGYVVYAVSFSTVGVLWEYAYLYIPMAICIGCALKVATLDGDRRRPATSPA